MNYQSKFSVEKNEAIIRSLKGKHKIHIERGSDRRSKKSHTFQSEITQSHKFIWPKIQHQMHETKHYTLSKNR